MPQPRIPRLHVDELPAEASFELGGDRAHYLRNVLRAKPGHTVTVFDGRGGELSAEIEHLTKSAARLRATASLEPLAESRLELHLIQAIAKSDAMDLIVQKATELGVTRIRPVMTEFSVVRLDPERAARRLEHWQRIARSACEQSGRHVVPEIDAPQPLVEALADDYDRALRLVLDPGAERSLVKILGDAQRTACHLLIGPEGGLSERDLSSAHRAGFEAARLGPRILRVETAAVTACSLVQAWWGDLS